jgi:LysR family hydrogen peroxide-inducible transcriptional activator
MPFRPSSRQLEYLIAVVETGHFRDAARACNVSQPTLSMQLQLLEKQLGTKLIDRSPGRAAPTPSGTRVVGLARGVLASLDEIVAVARDSSGNLGGLLRLGVAPTFGPYFMPHLLPRLHQSYSELEIYIREDRPAMLEKAAGAGEIDCGLAPKPAGHERLHYRELLMEPLYLGIPSEHPLARKKTILTSALAGERMLTLGTGHQLNQSARTLSQEAGAILREDYEGTSLDALRQMVSIGMGLSLFPAWYAASEFAKREDQVVLRRIADRQLSRSVGIYWREGHVREAQFETLADICAAVAADVEPRIDIR